MPGRHHELGALTPELRGLPFRHFGCALALLPAVLGAQASGGLPRARPEDVGISSAALRRIGPALQTFVDSGRLAGIVAAIARGGKLVYLESFGTMDSARKAPMRPDAVFRIYSMTKPVTTVAVLQLVERGKIRLDDPVSRYIPSFAGARVYSGGSARNPATRQPRQAITIGQLLTHTAGLTYGVFGSTSVDTMYRVAGLDRAEWTIERMADSLARLPLAAEPGTRWIYSLGVDVLGRVVEVASGKSLDRYFADEILRPLGMALTAFHMTPGMTDRTTALFSAGRGGTLRAGPALLAPIYREPARLLLGGQGLLSTVPDYLRFAQMLLNEGQLEGRRVLERETVASMMKNQLPSGVSFSTGYGFGFGGSVQLDSGAALVTSPGTFQWSGFATTFFWIDRRADLIGMVWAQRIPSLGALETEFRKLVYAAVLER